MYCNFACFWYSSIPQRFFKLFFFKSAAGEKTQHVKAKKASEKKNMFRLKQINKYVFLRSFFWKTDDAGRFIFHFPL